MARQLSDEARARMREGGKRRAAQFTSASQREARRAWAERYEGTDQHKAWGSKGYWRLMREAGFEKAAAILKQYER